MSKKVKNILLSIAARDEAFDMLISELSGIANVTVAGLDGFSLRDVDIFIGKKLSARALDDANRLEAVFAYKTGVDDFPTAELAARGVALCNSHVNSDRIAQYAFGLAVSLVSRIAEFDRRMRNGDWCGDYPYWRSIFDMRAGLVGYGGIGRAIHKLLAANGIECYTLDRGKTYENIGLKNSLEELCGACDILFLSLPKTDDTDKMFDAHIFELLGGKYIVNVGRSNCIDESALYAALESRTLGGAAIDTWREKPQTASARLKPFDVPFDKLDNIVLSSHKAMQTDDGHERYVADVLRMVKAYLATGVVENAVDPIKGY